MVYLYFNFFFIKMNIVSYLLFVVVDNVDGI